MKVRENNIKDAKALLEETYSLMGLLLQGIVWVQDSNSEEAQEAGGLAKYIVASRTNLQALHLNNFDRAYPVVSGAVSNGRAEDFSSVRIVDGIYKIGQLNAKLQASKCLLKTDQERSEVRGILYAAIGDLALFMVMQFGLQQGSDSVMLAVKEFCDARGMTPDVLYGELLNVIETLGQSAYGYEPVSPYYDDLMGLDPVFVAECEEAQFPLTEDLSKQIVQGSLSLEEARGMLGEFQRQSTQVEVKGISPTNMVGKLNLT